MNAFEATSTYLSPSLVLGSLFNMQTSSWNQKEQIVYKIVYIQFAIQPPGQSPCPLNSSMQLRVDFDWRQVPLFRLLLFATLGMLAVLKAWWVPSAASWIGSLALLLPLLFWEKLPWRFQFRLRWLPGLCLALACVLLGASRARQFEQNRQPSSLQELQNRWLLVQLNDPPAARNKSYRTTASILAASHEKTVLPAKGELLLYLAETHSNWQAGTRLWVWSKPLSEPPENRNPHGFSYRQYLARKGIYYQLYVGKGQWRSGAGSFAWWHPARLRATATLQLRSYLWGAESSALAQALLLGDRSALPAELVQAYSSSGLIHVLAVSGLHVGIVFLLLQTLLGKVLRQRKALLLAILLGCLWSYAAITGLSASVTRASLMCSVLALGKHWQRQAGVYNTLSGAALLLLWYQPVWLFDTGFQLSFAAVTGIVYLQPLLLKSVYVPHPWAYKVWELSCVTLSAQLFTLPLTLHYFGQFPNYFLLTNLLVLPLMAPLLGGCLLLLALSPLPFLAKPLGWLLGKGIGWLNELVMAFERLPGAVSSGIRLDGFAATLLFALLLTLSWWYVYRRQNMRIASLLLALLLLGKGVWQLHADREQALLVIYDNRREAAGALVFGQKAWYWGPKRKAPFAPQHPHFTALGIKNDVHLNDTLSRIWHWKQGSLLHLRGKWAVVDSLPPADWLLLSNQPAWRKLAPQLGKYKGILLDSSNSPYYCRKLQELAAQHHLPVRWVGEEGALLIPLWTTNSSNSTSTTASVTSSSTVPKSAMLLTPSW